MFDFRDVNIIGFDTETTGLTVKDRAFGFSVAVPGKSVYYDIRETPRAVEWFNDQMRGFRGTVACHNASFDYQMSKRAGINIPLERINDTVTRAVLIDENLQSYALDDLAAKYLNRRKDSDIYRDLAAAFGGLATRNVQMPNIAKAPASMIAKYAKTDAELVLDLYKHQGRQIISQGINKIVAFERSLLPMFIRAEMRGVRVDVERAREAQLALTIQIDKNQRELDRLIGRSVNVNSTPQIRAIFNPTKNSAGAWAADNGTVLGSTNSGAPSINSEALRNMGDDVRARLILGIRSDIKTRDTFLGGHVIGSAVDGRVFPRINQTAGEEGGTRTGRLSYTQPALQQLPSRGGPAVGIVKSVFLPDEGEKWVSFDMNSFEVRVFANFIRDPNIDAMYAKDEKTDFHQAVADLTGLPRNATYSGQGNSKQLNLSLIFGSGNGAIAAKMGMPWEWETFTARDGEEVTYRKAGPEAMEVIEKYHEMVPGVKAFMSRSKSTLAKLGYLETQMGRRMRCTNMHFAYKFHGLAIQATAADINKMGWRVLTEMNHPALLGVHDSFELSVPEDVDGLALKDEFQQRLRAAVPWFKTPLVVDLNGSGRNYYEATTKG